MIRNFPHQINAIPKLLGALQVARDILSRRDDLSDDAVYGYAVVRQQIYTFRRLVSPAPAQLEDRITIEQNKSLSDQGPRTFARDLRRTLLLLGFLNRDEHGALQITDIGNRILMLPPLPHTETRNLWINAVLRIELPASQALSPIHPAQNILRIVASTPNVEKRWLAFALCMSSDLEEELNRILELIRNGNFDEARQAEGASEYKTANAVKILPALLKQIGLISITSTRCNLTQLGLTVLSRYGPELTGIEMPTPTEPIRPRHRTPRHGFNVASADDITIPDQDEQTDRTQETHIHNAHLLNERTREHQRTVRTLVSSLQNVSQIRYTGDAFDVLAFSPDEETLLLFEVKTLRNDALAQARVAVGQLLFYEFFDVNPIANQREILKVAVFNAEPGNEVRGFLSHAGIFCVTIIESSISVPGELQQYFTP